MEHDNAMAPTLVMYILWFPNVGYLQGPLINLGTSPHFDVKARIVISLLTIQLVIAL